jgi:hypothetical protein
MVLASICGQPLSGLLTSVCHLQFSNSMQYSHLLPIHSADMALYGLSTSASTWSYMQHSSCQQAAWPFLDTFTGIECEN